MQFAKGDKLRINIKMLLCFINNMRVQVKATMTYCYTTKVKIKFTGATSPFRDNAENLKVQSIVNFHEGSEKQSLSSYQLTWLSEHEPKKDNMKGNTKSRQGRSTRPQPYKRITDI